MKKLFTILALTWLTNGWAQNGCSFLCNMDFELNPGGTNVQLMNQSLIPCWGTTATDGIIEYWYTGTLGTPAYSGNYFIELNAYQVSTLYQNFTPVPSSTVQISFAHRGRAGLDVMSVSIGPVGGPYTQLGTYSDDETAWGYYSVNFTFPPLISGPYSLRFNSISAAGGNPAIGNFLDAISVNFPSPQLNAVITNPSCSSSSDGSINLNINGGLPPYNIVWQAPIISNASTINNLASGTYSVEVTDSNGCQITENFSLIGQGQTSNVTLNESICQGSTYSFYGSSYNQNGTYTHFINSAVGCDTLVTLNLQVSPVLNTVSNVTACETYVINGQTLSQSGTYTVNLNSILGCDSSVTLNLTLNSNFEQNQNVISCGPYTWPINGLSYSQSGTFSQNYTSIQGCDSTYWLNLTVHPEYNNQINVTICENQTYVLDGNPYTEEGIYQVPLQSVFGCDSMITLSVDVEEGNEIINTTICGSQTYLFNGVAYGAGNHQIPYTSANGCSIVANLQITQVSGYEIIRFDTICSGQSIEIGNQQFGESGTYQVNLQTSQGCDSVIILNLFVKPNSDAIFYPNVFTPNGDNLNDFYSVSAKNEEISYFEFYVYNRWGNLIFKTQDPLFEWEGNYLNKSVSQGVYFFVAFYKIKCTGDFIHESKGTLTVLK